MDDVLQIHINIIFVCNTNTASHIICFSMCFISLKNKDESNPESIILNSCIRVIIKYTGLT